jgi:vancomycin resistance protein YoaR
MRKLIIFLFLMSLFFTISLFSAKGEAVSVLEILPSTINKLDLIIESQTEPITSEEISQWIQVHSSLKITPAYRSEIENIHYCPSNPLVCRLTITMRQSIHVKKDASAYFSEEKIKAFLEDLSRKINKDPIDAKFSSENGKVIAFALAQDGYSLNIDESAKKIIQTLSSDNLQPELKIDLVSEKIKPHITENSINDLGITSLIGEGKSNFKGSPKNRIFNINVGTQRFNGILIKPGEEFSFVKILGPVDGEHGYLPELVIKLDKTEPEFGGGICQVSTTAFRAAINSGLKITARKNHAYPVSYYNPQGMDATVYIPRPDLRFTNNTLGYILIQTQINGTELVFQFYGTDDGRKTEIDGPRILERNPDGSMKATFTQKVTDKNGAEIINDIFNSNYASPDKFPHPGQEKFTTKPKDWSKDQWNQYKKANKIP